MTRAALVLGFVTLAGALLLVFPGKTSSGPKPSEIRLTCHHHFRAFKQWGGAGVVEDLWSAEVAVFSSQPTYKEALLRFRAIPNFGALGSAGRAELLFRQR